MRIIVALTIAFSSVASADYLSYLESSESLHGWTMLAVLENREIYRKQFENGIGPHHVESLATVIMAWELSDASGNIETGDVLLSAWLHHPEVVATWFDSKPLSRKRWLESQLFLFSNLSFIDGYEKVEALRIDLLESLTKVANGDSITIEAYKDVLGSLELDNAEN